ncbi:hypothetical protein D3C86_1870990 [compost metagenome]
MSSNWCAKDMIRAQFKFNRETKTASFPLLAFHMDLTVHQLYDAFANDKSKPRPPILAGCRHVGLRKSTEQVALLLPRHPDPRIPDINTKHNTIFVLGSNVHFNRNLAFFRKFQCIVHQIK